MIIAAGQVRAARALLDWSRDELAEEAGLSRNTIRSIESGNISRRDTMDAVRMAFENAGIRFTEEEGIRKERVDIKVLKGITSCDDFFETIYDVAARKGGDIVAVFKSQEMMIKSLGIPNYNQLKRLEELKEKATLRCVLSDLKENMPSLPQCSKRVVPRYCIYHSFFVYGNRYAHVYQKGKEDFYFVIHNDVEIACAYREHFEELWDVAGSFQTISVERAALVAAV